MRKLVFVTLLMAITFHAEAALRPLKIEFRTSDTANLIWMVDQLSGWNPQTTDPEYRNYWDKKLGLSAEDEKMLDLYRKIRSRLSAEDKPAATGPVIFHEATVTKADQFLLAFLELPGLKTAVDALPASQADKDDLFQVYKHFGKKFGTAGEWGKETAHLAAFCKQAEVLSSLTDAHGYLTQVRDFLGITDMPAELIVDALWAPPGMMAPSPVLTGFHVILPVPVTSVRDDKEVVWQIGNSIQGTVKYMFSKLAPEVRAAGERYILARTGFLNPDQPDLMVDAISGAIAQVLFFSERLSDMPAPLLASPLRGDQPVPFAADELARRLAPELKKYLPKPGALVPDFLNRALEIQNELFPATPRTIASAALFIGNDEDLALMRQAFVGPLQNFFSLNEVDAMSRLYTGTNRPAFLVVRLGAINTLEPMLTKMGIGGRQLPDIKRFRKESVILPVENAKAGPVIVMLVDSRETLLAGVHMLYGMSSLPRRPEKIK